MNALDRFLRYVAFDTQSSAKTGTHPSTPGQIVLADAIADELRALGARDVRRSPDGYVYAAQPPLYKVTRGKQEQYVYSDSQLQKLLDEMGRDAKPEIQRYKGLGEMSYQQLWDTTMNPETRSTYPVEVMNLSACPLCI